MNTKFLTVVILLTANQFFAQEEHIDYDRIIDAPEVEPVFVENTKEQLARLKANYVALLIYDKFNSLVGYYDRKDNILVGDTIFSKKDIVGAKEKVLPYGEYKFKIEVNEKGTRYMGFKVIENGIVSLLTGSEFEEKKKPQQNSIVIPITPVLKKPVIYLYPEKEQKVNVQLDFAGKLTSTYPKYNDGWTVIASPNGTLKDADNREYYSLYWEGDANDEFIVDEGNVVEGAQTIEFLEETLANLGLNRREANEFIIYWLPQMEKNPYNLIHFSTKQYEKMAKLNITPTPETMIRVMMVFEPLNHPVSIKKQELNDLKIERKGFTVVEWGGQKINKQKSL